jgi:hypothetical protein
MEVFSSKSNGKGVVVCGDIARKVFGFLWKDEATFDPFSINPKSRFFEYSHPTIQRVIYRKFYDFDSHITNDEYSMNCMYKQSELNEDKTTDNNGVFLYAPYIICFVYNDQPTKQKMKQICSVFGDRTCPCFTEKWFVIDHTKLYRPSNDRKFGPHLVRSVRQYNEKLGLNTFNGMWNQLSYDIFESEEKCLRYWGKTNQQRIMIITEGIIFSNILKTGFLLEDSIVIMRKSVEFFLFRPNQGNTEYVIVFDTEKVAHEKAIELSKTDPVLKSNTIIWTSNSPICASLDHIELECKEQYSNIVHHRAYTEEEFWNFSCLKKDSFKQQFLFAIKKVFANDGSDYISENAKNVIAYNPNSYEFRKRKIDDSVSEPVACIQYKRLCKENIILDNWYKERDAIPTDIRLLSEIVDFDNLVPVSVTKSIFVKKYDVNRGDISYWIVECQSTIDCTLYWNQDHMDFRHEETKLCVKMCRTIETKKESKKPNDTIHRIFIIHHRLDDLCFCFHHNMDNKIH